jgi:restriction system protein
MAIENYQHYFIPVLRVLAEHGETQRIELREMVADQEHVSEEDRTYTNSRGTHILGSRVHWATAYLAQAKAIARPTRGYMAISERGRELLSRYPNGVGVEVLAEFSEFQEFMERAKASQKHGVIEEPKNTSVGSPQEQIESAIDALEASVAGDLVERLRTMPFEFLEHAVLKLLQKMGYGDSDDSLSHLGGSGDEGVDGVINQDALGLQQVYIQAKRYAADKTVGRPAVQSFVGALTGLGASGGVFITTSSFSQDALSYAGKNLSPRIVLIDGVELGKLMVRHDIGVQVAKIYHVAEIDEDFFAD